MGTTQSDQSGEQSESPVSLCNLIQQGQPVEEVTPENLKDTIIGLVDCSKYDQAMSLLNEHDFEPRYHTLQTADAIVRDDNAGDVVQELLQKAMSYDRRTWRECIRLSLALNDHQKTAKLLIKEAHGTKVWKSYEGNRVLNNIRNNWLGLSTEPKIETLFDHTSLRTLYSHIFSNVIRFATDGLTPSYSKSILKRFETFTPGAENQRWISEIANMLNNEVSERGVTTNKPLIDITEYTLAERALVKGILSHAESSSRDKFPDRCGTELTVNLADGKSYIMPKYLAVGLEVQEIGLKTELLKAVTRRNATHWVSWDQHEPSAILDAAPQFAVYGIEDPVKVVKDELLAMALGFIDEPVRNIGNNVDGYYLAETTSKPKFKKYLSAVGKTLGEDLSQNAELKAAVLAKAENPAVHNTYAEYAKTFFNFDDKDGLKMNQLMLSQMFHELDNIDLWDSITKFRASELSEKALKHTVDSGLGKEQLVSTVLYAVKYGNCLIDHEFFRSRGLNVSGIEGLISDEHLTRKEFVETVKGNTGIFLEKLASKYASDWLKIYDTFIAKFPEVKEKMDYAVRGSFETLWRRASTYSHVDGYMTTTYQLGLNTGMTAEDLKPRVIDDLNNIWDVESGTSTDSMKKQTTERLPTYNLTSSEKDAIFVPLVGQFAAKRKYDHAEAALSFLSDDPKYAALPQQLAEMRGMAS